jgi:hypothetical protein
MGSHSNGLSKHIRNSYRELAFLSHTELVCTQTTSTHFLEVLCDNYIKKYENAACSLKWHFAEDKIY